MLKEKNFNPNGENIAGVLIDNSQNQSQKITGILTSSIRPKPSANVDFYGFLRLEYECAKHSWEECERTKCKTCETPVIFKIKDLECDGSHHLFRNMFCWLKPQLKKGDRVILEGEFNPSKKIGKFPTAPTKFCDKCQKNRIITWTYQNQVLCLDHLQEVFRPSFTCSAYHQLINYYE